MRKLTKLKRAFALIYDGNGVDAARKAGYRGSSNVLSGVAMTNLRHPLVLELIESRTSGLPPGGIRKPSLVASRQARQEFWTRVLKGEEKHIVIVGRGKTARDIEVGPKMQDRLKASELLGRSQADFIERHEHTGKDGSSLLPTISDEERRKLAQLLK